MRKNRMKLNFKWHFPVNNKLPLKGAKPAKRVGRSQSEDHVLSKDYEPVDAWIKANTRRWFK